MLNPRVSNDVFPLLNPRVSNDVLSPEVRRSFSTAVITINYYMFLGIIERGASITGVCTYRYILRDSKTIASTVVSSFLYSSRQAKDSPVPYGAGANR